MTQLYNTTQLQVGYTTGLMKSGRNCLVIVAKATYDFPSNPQSEAVFSAEPIPLFETDAYAGEPGYSAPTSENDYPPRKHQCDVILLNAVAYAPEGEPVSQIETGVRIGDWEKRIRIVGDRCWRHRWMSHYESTEPEPFEQMPIGYENAYGGTVTHPDPGQDEGPQAYKPNPIGRGYLVYNDKRHIIDSPLPNTEALDQPVQTPYKDYQPVAFGPVARNWLPRSGWGGTYDEHWQEHKKPLLPDDFDERYYQCAPEDQWIDYPRGGEVVILTYLTPEGETRFNLPQLAVPMQVIFANGDRHNLNPVIDTLMIDPTKRQFTLTWRARVGLRHNIHEVDLLIVGRPTPGWERAHMMDKPYWKLSDLNAIRAMFKRRLAQEEKLRRKREQAEAQSPMDANP